MHWCTGVHHGANQSGPLTLANRIAGGGSIWALIVCCKLVQAAVAPCNTTGL